jgi:hypothetical protein
MLQHWIFDVIKISTSDQHFLNWTSVVTPAILEFEFLVVDALLVSMHIIHTSLVS